MTQADGSDANLVEQVVAPTEPGPVDPSIVTELEGGDASVAPTEDQIAFGAAGDVPGLVTTPQGLQDGVNAQVTTTGPDASQLESLTKAELSAQYGVSDNQTKDEMIQAIVNPQPQGVTHEVELQDTVGQQDLA